MPENEHDTYAVNELRITRAPDGSVVVTCSLCGHQSADAAPELSDAQLLEQHRAECPGKPQTTPGEHVVRRIRSGDERKPPRRADVD